MKSLELDDYSYDESFKALGKRCFSSIGQVTTDYELLVRPKRADMVITMNDEAKAGDMVVFDYFKKVNVIEFKSEVDTFRFDEHRPKLNFYLGGVLQNVKEAKIENTTVSLVSSRKPKKLLDYYKNSTQLLKKGVYCISGILECALHVVVINEVEGAFGEELAFLKAFATGRERESHLLEVLRRVVAGEREYMSYLYYAFSLYKDELKALVEKEGLTMTLIERNILSWVEDLNLKERFFKEAKMDDARKMLEMGFELEVIGKVTGLPEETISELLVNC